MRVKITKSGLVQVTEPVFYDFQSILYSNIQTVTEPEKSELLHGKPQKAKKVRKNGTKRKAFLKRVKRRRKQKKNL